MTISNFFSKNSLSFSLSESNSHQLHTISFSLFMNLLAACSSLAIFINRKFSHFHTENYLPLCVCSSVLSEISLRKVGFYLKFIVENLICKKKIFFLENDLELL